MSSESFRAKAYLKVGCPFSFKFLVFASEARLLDRIDVIRCDPEDPQFADIKAKLERGSGGKATFPTVEIAPGKYKSDSSRLIEHYAAENGVAVEELIALRFYTESIFPQLRKHHEQQKR